MKKMISGTVQFDALGWCKQARIVPSPNCDARSSGMPVDMVVIHNIHLPPEHHLAAGILSGCLPIHSIRPLILAMPNYPACAFLRIF